MENPTNTPAKKRNKRGHNEGSIRKRPDGVWEARVTCGYDLKTGKPIRKSFYSKNRKVVKDKMDKALTELRLNGTISSNNTYTVGEWLNYWVINYKAPNIENGSVQGLFSTIKTHLHLISDIKLDKLRPAQVQQIYNGIDTSKSTRTVERVHSCLNDAYNHAIKLGYVNYNPTQATFLPKRKQTATKALDKDKQQIFLAALNGSEYRNLMRFYLLTGLRRGELVALRWSDIDFDNKTIDISGTAVEEKDFNTGRRTLKRKEKTKTSAGLRKLPITTEVSRVLQDQQIIGGKYVFPNPDGTMMSLYKPYKEFKALCEKAGLQGYTLHSLRHTFATRVFESGVLDKVNQALLGHASDFITKQIYVHANQDFIREEAKKIVILDD